MCIRDSAVVADEVQERLVEAMVPLAVGVSIKHYRLGVVAQHAMRCTAEELEGVLQAADERLHPLVVGKLGVAVARPAKVGRQCHEHRWAPAEDDEVDLRLATGFGLEAHHRLGLDRGAN